jgi:outer membrane autotransporter barrel domain
MAKPLLARPAIDAIRAEDCAGGVFATYAWGAGRVKKILPRSCGICGLLCLLALVAVFSLPSMRARAADGLASALPSQGGSTSLLPYSVVHDALDASPLAKLEVEQGDDDEVPLSSIRRVGEIHSTMRGNLILLDRNFARQLSGHISRSSLGRRPVILDESTYMDPDGYDRFATSSGGYYGSRYNVWGTIGGTRSEMDSRGKTAKSTFGGPEVAVGIDALSSDGALAGLALQYSYKDLGVDARSSQADVYSYSLALYAGRELEVGGNVLRLLVGGIYSYHDISSSRSMRTELQRETLAADYSANSVRLYAEGAYSMVIAEKFHIEPLVNFGWSWLRTGTFTEEGGQTALEGASKPSENVFTILGLRLDLPLMEELRVNAFVGWEHQYGNLDPSVEMAFRGHKGGFSLKGNEWSRDELLLGVGAGLDLGDSLRLTLNYDGAFGNVTETHSGTATLIYRW